MLGHQGRQVMGDRQIKNESSYLSSVHLVSALDLALYTYYAVQSSSKSCDTGKIIIPIFRGKNYGIEPYPQVLSLRTQIPIQAVWLRIYIYNIYTKLTVKQTRTVSNDGTISTEN